MSQSTTAELESFSINIKRLDDENMMRQNSFFTNILKIIPRNTLNMTNSSKSSKKIFNSTLIEYFFYAVKFL